jgi:hypothetical protein
MRVSVDAATQCSREFEEIKGLCRAWHPYRWCLAAIQPAMTRLTLNACVLLRAQMLFFSRWPAAYVARSLTDPLKFFGELPKTASIDRVIFHAVGRPHTHDIRGFKHGQMARYRRLADS